MAYLNQVKKPKPSLPLIFKFRDKGCIIECLDYDCFMYKSHPLYKKLAEQIAKACAEKVPIQKFRIVPDSTQKCGFKFEKVEGEQMWYPYQVADETLVEAGISPKPPGGLATDDFFGCID